MFLLLLIFLLCLLPFLNTNEIFGYLISEKWHLVLLLNKYDLGLLDIDYKIRLSDPTPIKLYIPRYSQGVREAISKELEKMKEANFIEPSISPFAAPMVCV